MATERVEKINRLEGAVLLGSSSENLREIASSIADNDDVTLRARALLRRSELAMVGGDLNTAIDDALAAWELLDEANPWWLRTALQAARLLGRSAKPERGKEILAEVQDRACVGKPQTQLALHMTRGELALDTQQLDEARASFEAALELATDPSVAHERHQALTCMAAIHQLQARPQSAVPWLEQAVQVAQQHGDQRRAADGAFTIANIATQAKQLERAYPLYQQALQGQLNPLFRPVALMVLARIDLARGAPQAALDHAVMGAKAAAAVNNPGFFADGSILAAQAQQRMDRPDDARRTLEAGRSALERQGHAEHAKLVAAEAEKLEDMV